LCSACRHEAGLAAKQAIADRAAEERAELDRRRLEREQAEERQRQLDQQAAERQRLEEARLHAERDRLQAEAQMPMTPVPVPTPVIAAIGADVDDTPEELDPYAVLGVSRAASRQQIDSAYCAAASKYDETQVAHLGDAVQAHYRSKAEAIEHAYRTLIAG
jgi:DnaJ-domain-containing protein 1